MIMKKYTYTLGEDQKDHNEDSDARGASGARPLSTVTSLEINQNVAGALTYLLGWVTGFFFLLIEKENSFVRFHAMQSVVVFVAFTIASIVVGWLAIVGGVLTTLLGFVGIFVWLFLMYQAFLGVRYKLPYAGDFAEKQLENVGSK
jgi:uncharacterized membrane protein